MKSRFAVNIIAVAVFLLMPQLARADDPAALGAGNPKVGLQLAQADVAIIRNIRLLFRFQDLAASGDHHAMEGQQLLLGQIRNMLMDGESQSANAVAPWVAGYVLSGGDPAVIARLQSHEGLVPARMRLLEGASAFMLGDREAARKEFTELNADTVPASIRGRLSLSQAILTDDRERRQELLSQAMSSMPGSLIEESALRRSAMLYLDSGAVDDLWNRLNRYQRRFSRSSYAQPFYSSLMKQIVAAEAKGLHIPDEKVDEFLNNVALPFRRHLLLELAQRAAESNLVLRTSFAAKRLARIALTGSQEDQQARLYATIFRVAGPEAQDALQTLRGIDRGRLPELEQALLAASLAVGSELAKPIGASEKLPQSPPEVDAEARGETAIRQQLDIADKLLNSLSR